MNNNFFNFEYYLFDLWGVIHDGSLLYPGVYEVLQKLKTLNKNVAFISNAPRRAVIAKQTLHSLGVKESFTKNVMTSGECFYNYLLSLKNHTRYNNNNVFYIGPTKDISLLDGLNFNIITKNPENAQFGIITGFGDDVANDENLQNILHKCLDVNLKLCCINPDLVVIRQDGSFFECAGIIADMYKKLGGTVEYFGKPYPEIYNQVFKMIGVDGGGKSKVIAIGDSISTDIAGASQYGIASAFCTYGIHSKDIKQKSLEAFISSAKFKPNIIINTMKDLL